MKLPAAENARAIIGSTRVLLPEAAGSAIFSDRFERANPLIAMKRRLKLAKGAVTKDSNNDGDELTNRRKLGNVWPRISPSSAPP
jgi:hypothetical protein